MNIFGGGFTAPPNSSCKLRQGMQQQPQQFTSPVVKVGNLPAPTFGVQPTVPAPQLGVQPRQNVQGFARPVMSAPAATPPPIQIPPAAAPAAPAAQSPSIYVQGNSPMGPTSYKVMKKGEAPCPVCRG